jgi:hypothetical protein
LLHLHNHLVSGLVILLVQGVGGATQIVFRVVSDRASARIGLTCLIVGMAVVGFSLREANAAAFVLGDLVSGVGFGFAFLSGTRRVSRAAPAARRGEVMAAYFLVAYLAISLPVLAVAGVADRLGLARTYDLFAVSVALLCAAALIGAVVIDRKQ